MTARSGTQTVMRVRVEIHIHRERRIDDISKLIKRLTPAGRETQSRLPGGALKTQRFTIP
jgi:hypothetical protein